MDDYFLCLNNQWYVHYENDYNGDDCDCDNYCDYDCDYDCDCESWNENDHVF